MKKPLWKLLFVYWYSYYWVYDSHIISLEHLLFSCVFVSKRSWVIKSQFVYQFWNYSCCETTPNDLRISHIYIRFNLWFRLNERLYINRQCILYSCSDDQQFIAWNAFGKFCENFGYSAVWTLWVTLRSVWNFWIFNSLAAIRV